MKLCIKVASAGKFAPDQEAIIKRISIVLVEHDLSVKIDRKVKKSQIVTLKKVV